mgnify:CR=1 FL=1
MPTRALMSSMNSSDTMLSKVLISVSPYIEVNACLCDNALGRHFYYKLFSRQMAYSVSSRFYLWFEA